jgi:hypothetical protein
MKLRYLLMLPLLAVAVPALAASCKETAGEGWAKAYVEQCTEVSTAAHPPCNVDNPCELIISEITRGCSFMVKGGDDVPPYCKPELSPEQKDDGAADGKKE